jgi:hypothetical protein
MMTQEEGQNRHVSMCQAMLTRVELEDLWRARLKEAQECYHSSANKVRLLISASRSDRDALCNARQAQHEAITNYERVLRIFNDLILRGRIPEE